VLVTAIAVGVFCFLGSTAFMDGMARQMIDSTVDLQGGHIQVARVGYQENPTIRTYLDDPAAVEAALREEQGLRYAPRVVASGMANSAEQAAGVMIQGIDAAREPGVTPIASMVVEGAYLTPGGDARDVVIGVGLAEHLNVAVGEKIVLMINDLDNEISAGAYRITGLYRTNSTAFDRSNVYLHLAEAQRLAGYTRQVSAFSVRLDDSAALEPVAQRLRGRIGGEGVTVLTWKERSPFLVVAMQMYDYSVVILVAILFTAVAFTIVNSFLMVILERVREIGIMMASGVRPGQVRLMLFTEAVFVALLGIGLGSLIAAGVLGLWATYGLDLSAFAQGLGFFGVSAVVYPYFDWFHIALGFSIIAVMVMLAVLYPALRASRYEVVEAINYV
jgi:ABC-type lipoprotein release transport system permease subunit